MENHRNLASGSLPSGVNFLSLPQSCLEQIMRYMDHDSFHSVLLTCKKLSSFSYSPSACCSSLLYRRGIYHLLRCFFSVTKTAAADSCESQLLTKVTDILAKALDWSNFLSSVSLSKIIETWETEGPVFGKLHSLVSFYDIKEENGEPGPLCTMNHKFMTFDLPSGKQLEVQLSMFDDFSAIHGSQEALQAVTGPVCIVYDHDDRDEGKSMLNRRSLYWRNSDKVIDSRSDDLNCLNPIGRLIEKEFDEIAPSGIKGELLREFVVTFPNVELVSCYEDITFKNEEFNKLDKLSLKQQYLNKRKLVFSRFWKDVEMSSIYQDSPLTQGEQFIPTPECTSKGNIGTLAPEKQDETNRAKLSPEGTEELEETNEHGRQYGADKLLSEFANLAYILMAREDCARLATLHAAVSHFQTIKNKLNSSNLQRKNAVATNLFQNLLFRVNFDSILSYWGPGDIANKWVYVKVDFKLCGPHVLSFIATSHIDLPFGEDNPFYYDQTVEFDIPTLNTHVDYSFEDTEDLSYLGPVTAEIQKCVDKDCPGIKVTDAFVVMFFILVLGKEDALDVRKLENCLADEIFLKKSCSDSDKNVSEFL